MRYLILFLLISFNIQAESLKELSLEYKRYIGTAIIPIMYTRFNRYEPTNEIRLNLDINLTDSLFWDNKIRTRMDSTQFRTISWDFTVGYKIFNNLSIEFEHYSEHLLDVRLSPFPNHNTMGFKWIIK